MKVYVVIDRDVEERTIDFVFGVFDNLEKATEIRDNMRRNFEDHNEAYEVDILELNLNETTDDYEWFINN